MGASHLPPATGRASFAILGPISAQLDGVELDLGGVKRRALLADLLVHAGRTVTTDQLVWDLWGEAPPPTAPKMIQNFVSQLRRMLTPEGESARYLVTDLGGYHIAVDRDQLDLFRFVDRAQAAEALLGVDPAAAAAELSAALEYWRGPALADVAAEPFAGAIIGSLEELRLTTLERRFEAELSLGTGQQLIAELSELAAAHPYRERFHGQLMLALYRSGRHVEALSHYQSVWNKLADELGVRPGVELSALNTAILRQDSRLLPTGMTPRASPGLTTPASPRPRRTGAPEGGDRHAEPEPEPEPEPEHTVATTRSPPGPGHRRTQWTLGKAVAAACIVLAILAISGEIAAPHRSALVSQRIASNSLAVVDAADNQVLADVPVGAHPGPVTFGSGSIWVGNTADKTLTRLDASDLRPQRVFGLNDPATSLTAQPGMVWIAGGFSGTLVRVLTRYDELTQPTFPQGETSGLLAMAGGDGALWVGTGNNRLLRLDPASLRVERNLPVPGHVRAIALAAGQVWTIQFTDRVVRKFDAQTGHPAGTTPVPGQPTLMCAQHAGVWVVTAGNDVLWHLNSTTGIITGSIPLGTSPSGLACATDGIWVSSGLSGLLLHVEARSTTLVQTLALHHPIGGLVAADGKIWLSID